ncbi:hypothetical protein BrevBR_16165 [Brevundimonas sp. BR2-1]|uniref:hypothetical protein n=1 Tax=Brevundimonas sp. BR2-1 TaxID=3031123 RepID=UPI0030B22AA6
MDRPLPDNLPVARACLKCNNGFSEDEEYLACLLECVISGSSDPSQLGRPSVARALEQNGKLQKLIESGRKESGSGPVWDFDVARVRRVLLKQARGHVAHELNEPQLSEPSGFWFGPLESLNDAQRQPFELGEPDDWEIGGWPEVGSRAMQRLLICGDQAYSEPWLIVQDGRYRYQAYGENGWTVRMVLSEYLAGIVVWQ